MGHLGAASVSHAGAAEEGRNWPPACAEISSRAQDRGPGGGVGQKCLATRGQVSRAEHGDTRPTGTDRHRGPHVSTRRLPPPPRRETNFGCELAPERAAEQTLRRDFRSLGRGKAPARLPRACRPGPAHVRCFPFALAPCVCTSHLLLERDLSACRSRPSTG